MEHERRVLGSARGADGKRITTAGRGRTKTAIVADIVPSPIWSIGRLRAFILQHDLRRADGAKIPTAGLGRTKQRIVDEILALAGEARERDEPLAPDPQVAEDDADPAGEGAVESDRSEADDDGAVESDLSEADNDDDNDDDDGIVGAPFVRTRRERMANYVALLRRHGTQCAWAPRRRRGH